MAQLINELSYTFDDVLFVPQYSEIDSRSEIDLSVEFLEGINLQIPVMSANMQTINSVELCVALSEAGGMATIDQFQDISKQIDMLIAVKKQSAKVAGAIGATKDYLERAKALIENNVDLIVMDTPHGHNKLTLNAIKEYRKLFKNFPLVVGNIATKEAAKDLIEAGADGIKVGVGPGAACTTRVQTGVGMPQVTAIMECFEYIKDKKAALIADGGIKTPGSFAKALAAGGTTAYIGSLFAGTNEAPGEMVEVNGKKYKEYFGSSSTAAKLKRKENDKNYKEDANRHVEGASGYTKYVGSVKDLINDLTMGLRSAMAYTGAKNLKEFQQKAVFKLVTHAGLAENGAHGIVTI